jgi:hypothetical protein
MSDATVAQIENPFKSEYATPPTPEEFQEGLKASFEREIKVYPARNQWPSNAGHPCDRFLVWRRTRWQEQAPHDAGLEAIFKEGRLHQPAIIARLEKMGFEITETDGAFEYAGYSGRIDGKFKSYREQRFRKAIPFEAKTCSPYVFDAINTEQDIISAERHYIRGYRNQLQLYMIMDNSELGYYIFKNKLNGWLKLIPSVLDWNLADQMVKRSQRIDSLVADHVDPDPIQYNRDICGRCGFLQSCFPGRDYGEGAELLNDPNFEAMLEEYLSLKPMASRHDKLEKQISDAVKGHPMLLVGNMIIEGEERPRKGRAATPDGVTWKKWFRRVGEKPAETEE